MPLGSPLARTQPITSWLINPIPRALQSHCILCLLSSNLERISKIIYLVEVLKNISAWGGASDNFTIEPAALLAESLSQSAGDNGGGF